MVFFEPVTRHNAIWLTLYILGLSKQIFFWIIRILFDLKRILENLFKYGLYISEISLSYILIIYIIIVIFQAVIKLFISNEENTIIPLQYVLIYIYIYKYIYFYIIHSVLLVIPLKQYFYVLNKLPCAYSQFLLGLRHTLTHLIYILETAQKWDNMSKKQPPLKWFFFMWFLIIFDYYLE